MTSLPSRRSVLLGGAAAAFGFAATGCSSDSGTAPAAGASGNGIEMPKVNLCVFPSFNGLGGAIARDAGLFTKQGLTATLSTVATPAEAIPQLLGGKIHFALLDMTMPLVARSKGVPLVLVAPGASGAIPQHSGSIGFVNIWVAADSPFKTAKDLETATIAVPAINSQVWCDVRSAIDADGGDSSKVRFVEAPNTLQALKSGQAQATTTADPSGTKALADSSIRPLTPIQQADGALSYAFATTVEFAKKNPGTVQAFQDAIIAANKLANSNKAEAVKATATLMKLPPELLEKAIYPRMVEAPIATNDVQTALDRLGKYGLLTGQAPKPEDLIWKK